MSKTLKVILIIVVIILLIGGLYSLFGRDIFKEKENNLTAQNSDIVITEDVSLGTTLSAPKLTPLSLVLQKATEKAGFRVYYPSFIPSEIFMDKIKINITPADIELKVVDCTLGDPMSTSPWIMILEYEMDENGRASVQRQIDALETRKETTINGLSAQTGTKGIFNRVIFVTNDNTGIIIHSKNFDLEILRKIAESMK